MNNNIIIKNLLWKFLERGGVQGVQFVVQIILARLLMPEDYGTVGLVVVFISIANIFVQSGLGSALVQSKNPTQVDFSTVFFINIIIAILMIIILFFLAPKISMFYNTPILTPVLRIQSLVLLINSFSVVQNAIMQKKMQFKKMFFASLGGVIFSGIIGVFFAYNKAGVWALVIQQLINAIVVVSVLWFTIKWRPSFILDLKHAKILFKFGSRLLGSSLIDTIYNNIYPLIIGKFYTKNDLGYYNRGIQIPYIIVNNFNGSIQGVMFPAFSECQADKNRLKQILRRSIVTGCYLIFPLMAGLISTAKPLTVILLTEKWLPSVPFMQISCIMYAMWPIHTANLQAINALGRSDIFLKLELIKKGISIFVLGITIPMGIYAMILGSTIISIIGTGINAFPNKKLLNYKFNEQIKDIVPIFFIAAVMCIISSSILIFQLNIGFTLFLQVVVSVVVYIGLSWILKLECFIYIINTLNSSIRVSRKEKNDE